MDTHVQSAVRSALDHLEICSPVSGDRSEYARLRELRELGLMRPLTARIALLVSLGWRRADVAEAMDVSRVTIANWLREHTNGVSTFDPYAADSSDPDSIARDRVFAPIANKLSARNAEVLVGARFEHDKFIVPAGMTPVIASLWRVAYRARGAALTADSDVQAAADALDVMISLLLRRGVTNVAIAHAAGVTHRAVLDRMNRARGRGLLLSCDTVDDACEAFLGENDVRRVWQLGNDSDAQQSSDWLDGGLLGKPYAIVRVTSTRPSRYWLQTLMSYADSTAYLLAEELTKRPATLRILDIEPDPRMPNEVFFAARLGRLSEESLTSCQIAQVVREHTMTVPAQLLYTEAVERTGLLPSTPLECVSHVPAGLWDRYFEPSELVKLCFDDPQKILDDPEYRPTTKHPDDAKTRRAVAV